MFALNPIALGVMTSSKQQSPSSCTITLTGDSGPVFGLQPALVDGQRVYVESASANLDYLASTDLGNPTPIWTGTRIVELVDVAGDADVQPAGGMMAPDLSVAYLVYWLGTQWGVAKLVGGSPVATETVAGSITDTIAIGFSDADGDGTGDFVIYQNTTAVSLPAAFTGQPLPANVCLAGLIDSQAGGAGKGASISFRTNGADYISDYGGALDWCGKEIPAPPAPDLVTPDTIATEGVDVFYFNPSLPGTLWADRDGTTPAGSTVDSPVLRMDNLSSRTSENMVAPLDMSGFKRSSPDRLRKIDNYGVLALDSEFSEVEGITIALDVTTTGSGEADFFGGGDGTPSNRIRVYRTSSGGNVVVYVHTHMHSFSGAMSASNPHSARLIATITQDAVTLYVNGKLHGTMPPNWSRGNPFSHICVGASDKNMIANANATWGRVAVLKEALDEARVEKLDKWLALGDYSEEPVTVTATFDPVKTHEQITLSDGNRRASCTNSSRHYWTQLQPAKSSGKWFVEYLVHTASRPLLGVTHALDQSPDGTISPWPNGGIAALFFTSARRLNRDTTSSQTMAAGDIFDTPVAGDRITVAYDIDNLLFYLYRNGIPAADNPFPLDFEPAGPEVVPMARLIGPLDDIEIVTNPKWPIPGFQPWGG